MSMPISVLFTMLINLLIISGGEKVTNIGLNSAEELKSFKYEKNYAGNVGCHLLPQGFCYNGAGAMIPKNVITNVASASACCDLCKEPSRFCVKWTYHERTCSIFGDSYVPKVQIPRCIGGQLINKMNTNDNFGCNMLPTNLCYNRCTKKSRRASNVASASECCKLCTAHSKICRKWTYLDGKCWLMESADVPEYFVPRCIGGSVINQTKVTCKEDQFACSNKMQCIDSYKVCSKDWGHTHLYYCADGSDKTNAACQAVCTGPNKFLCKDSSFCIPKTRRCDGIQDCEDNSDEIGCVERNCEHNHLCATDRQKCIGWTFVCDGEIHCSDGSDEANCEENNCCGNFLCDNRRCLRMRRVCDGTSQCGDWSDEPRSEKECADTCKRFGYHTCADKSRCIHKYRICDHIVNCNDASDEKGCPNALLLTRADNIPDEVVSASSSRCTPAGNQYRLTSRSTKYSQHNFTSVTPITTTLTDKPDDDDEIPEDDNDSESCIWWIIVLGLVIVVLIIIIVILCVRRKRKIVPDDGSKSSK